MSDPGDAALLGFAAAFVGWRDLTSRGGQWEGIRRGYIMDNWLQVPDYLGDLNAWHRDVWQRVRTIEGGASIEDAWFNAARENEGPGLVSSLMNISARSRCLALYIALDGKLPERTA